MPSLTNEKWFPIVRSVQFMVRQFLQVRGAIQARFEVVTEGQYLESKTIVHKMMDQHGMIEGCLLRNTNNIIKK